MRASTLKFVGIVCVALAALITLIAFVPTYAVGKEDTPAGVQQSGSTAETTVQNNASDSVSISYDKIKSAEDAAAFLSQFGWKVDAGTVKCAEVTIPSKFDKIFAGYNQLQKEQGFDLSKYKNKKITRYTFSVTNHPDTTDPVYANVLVYRNRVIGGDICSADVSGFVHGFEHGMQKSQ